MESRCHESESLTTKLFKSKLMRGQPSREVQGHLVQLFVCCGWLVGGLTALLRAMSSHAAEAEAANCFFWLIIRPCTACSRPEEAMDLSPGKHLQPGAQLPSTSLPLYCSCCCRNQIVMQWPCMPQVHQQSTVLCTLRGRLSSVEPCLKETKPIQ